MKTFRESPNGCSTINNNILHKLFYYTLLLIDSCTAGTIANLNFFFLDEVKLNWKIQLAVVL